METFERRTDRLTWIGLALSGLGPSLLLVATWVEYVNDPSLGLFGGYDLGREPWTSAGIWLFLAGTALALLAGSGGVLVRGDWLRRILLVPVLGMWSAWWAVALGTIPYPRFSGPDPVTLAYTFPIATAVMLLLPALAVATLSFLPMGRDLRIRLRPVHPEVRTDRHR